MWNSHAFFLVALLDTMRSHEVYYDRSLKSHTEEDFKDAPSIGIETIWGS